MYLRWKVTPWYTTLQTYKSFSILTVKGRLNKTDFEFCPMSKKHCSPWWYEAFLFWITIQTLKAMCVLSVRGPTYLLSKIWRHNQTSSKQQPFLKKYKNALLILFFTFNFADNTFDVFIEAEVVAKTVDQNVSGLFHFVVYQISGFWMETTTTSLTILSSFYFFTVNKSKL